ncbi:MAG: hypothetical protein M1377_06595 [Deltaproteobacteria bacterium]|nr:hypothetical protein [Deltaproteobacteria bacterium]MDA8178541.1 hypothetical protein [Deltaproteobacteria bacterium]
MASINKLIEGFRKRQTNVKHRDYFKVLSRIGAEVRPGSGSRRTVLIDGKIEFNYHEPHPSGKSMNPLDVLKLLDYIDRTDVDVGGEDDQENSADR